MGIFVADFDVQGVEEVIYFILHPREAPARTCNIYRDDTIKGKGNPLLVNDLQYYKQALNQAEDSFIKHGHFIRKCTILHQQFLSVYEQILVSLQRHNMKIGKYFFLMANTKCQ